VENNHSSQLSKFTIFLDSSTGVSLVGKGSECELRYSGPEIRIVSLGLGAILSEESNEIQFKSEE